MLELAAIHTFGNTITVALIGGVVYGLAYWGRSHTRPTSYLGTAVMAAFLALAFALANDVPVWMHYSRAQGGTSTGAYLARRDWGQMSASEQWVWRLTAGGLMLAALSSGGCAGVWLGRRTR